jgi:hypothetical protein
MRLSCFGAGAPVGDGAGVGLALGWGVGDAGTQNVPSEVHHPARPFLSTPGMSSDFGGAVRAGAGVVLGTGAALGADVGAGTVVPRLKGTGAIQSSG